MKTDTIDDRALEQWDGRMWRKPDVFVDSSDVGLGAVAIWYGPAGPEGDVATEVDLGWDSITIAEYQATEGYFDEPAPEQFLVTSTGIDIEDVIKVLKAHKKPKPKNTEELLRWAAGLGVAKISYWGGEEYFEPGLPA